MRKLWLTGALVLLGTVAVTTLAPAQTTSNGPYYATPSWDQQLPASTRFIVLLNWGSAAVLDRETGLVWEKSPSASRPTWIDAQTQCYRLTTGGRLGWRLPTIPELASLMDPSVPSPGPTLPAGHPFINVQVGEFAAYWSANTSSFNTPFLALAAEFGGGLRVEEFAKTNGNFVWCVRGGQGVDPHGLPLTPP